MGGSGSTRWNQTITRRSTDGVLRLDVRDLGRQGALQSGTRHLVIWSDGVSIVAHARSMRVLALHYNVMSGAGKSVPVDEAISLVTTPCTFGGERVWALCPGCGTRRAVLYAPNGVFRCRTCHHLAYDSARQQ